MRRYERLVGLMCARVRPSLAAHAGDLPPARLVKKTQPLAGPDTRGKCLAPWGQSVLSTVTSDLESFGQIPSIYLLFDKVPLKVESKRSNSCRQSNETVKIHNGHESSSQKQVEISDLIHKSRCRIQS